MSFFALTFQHSRLAYIVCGGLLCTACSSNNSDPMESAENQVDADIAAIFGTWNSQCFDNDGPREFSEWTFGADTLVVKAFSYEPTDTLYESPTDDFITTYNVTYLPDRQETLLGAAIRYDLVPIAVTASGVDLVVDGIIPADVGDEYQIAQVSGNRLLGGDLSTGDASSSETRPTQLDSESFLTRR